MITNWYSTNINPVHLSRRLRIAYALWLWETVNNQDELPSLEQIQSARLYDDISPYTAIAEGRRGGDACAFTYASVGKKIDEVYGRELTALPLGEVLTDAGRTLAAESFAALRKERRPVHLGVQGSPVLSGAIQMIVIPLRHDDDEMELAGLVYDYKDPTELHNSA